VASWAAHSAVGLMVAVSWAVRFVAGSKAAPTLVR
jgi:hypothetical protein